MEIMFTADELDVLARVVYETLADLRGEIRETDNFEFKQTLKIKEECLKGVQAKLEHAGVATVN